MFAGYKAMEKMLEVNQGLRWRFDGDRVLQLLIPQELIALTQLMGRENEDVITEEESSRCCRRIPSSSTWSRAT